MNALAHSMTSWGSERKPDVSTGGMTERKSRGTGSTGSEENISVDFFFLPRVPHGNLFSCVRSCVCAIAGLLLVSTASQAQSIDYDPRRPAELRDCDAHDYHGRVVEAK